MTIISQPDTTFNIVGANTVVANEDQKVLFVGTSDPAGSAVDRALITSIGNNESDLNSQFGSRAPLSAMLRAARKVNKITRFDAISLNITGSAAATSTITFGGTATTTGSIVVSVGSRQDYTFTLSVAIGDTANDLAAALNTAIGANSLVPVTSGVVTNVVTLTNAVQGLNGNKMGISISQTGAAGITASVTAFSGGTGSPNLTNVFDVIGDERYQTIVWEYSNVASELQELITFLDSRFNVNNKIQDGVGVVSNNNTFANLTAQVNVLNSQSIIYLGDKLENLTDYIAPAQFELDWVKSAYVGGIRALRFTPNASISQFVISSAGPLDAVGGPALASKPYFNTPISQLPIIDTDKGWTSVEVEDLKTAGIFVSGNNIARNSAILGEVVTTYKTDTAGNPDESFKFLNFVDTLSNIREYYQNNFRSRFAQSRMTLDDVTRGRDMFNEIVVTGYAVRLFQDLASADFVLVRSGENALEFFKQNLVVNLNLQTGTTTIQMQMPIVVQGRAFVATIQVSFSTDL